MRRFNTAGKCTPALHYMVNIDRQVEAAAQLVRQGDYFCINRGRQYGKTTTFDALKVKLETEGYAVFAISLEGMSDTACESLEGLLYAMVLKINDAVEWNNVACLSATTSDLFRTMENEGRAQRAFDVSDFSRAVSRAAVHDRIVLLIDEVDQAANYPAFLRLLALLREKFLARNERPTFHSIILAGVYDVKNLKLRIRHEEEHRYNSPWNIAVPFDVDMSLPADGIAAMLADYRADHGLHFDERPVAQMIRDYTGGYPFLVSRICQIIDAESWTWDKEGVLRAVNTILVERNTLFDNMVKKLDDYPELRQMLKGILLNGRTKTFNPDERHIQIASMLSYIINKGGKVAVACRIMETRLYNLFISEEEDSDVFRQAQIDRGRFVHDGLIDMQHLLERFVVHMRQTYSMDSDNEFVENDARKVFLTYLRPIINGVGNYYIEAQTRDHDRMDVVIDFSTRNIYTIQN